MNPPHNKSGRSLVELVDDLQAHGRYTFDRDEATLKLQANPVALKQAVMRLVEKKRLAVPRRGFYVIVPVEYREPGSPPPSWFIDDLMRHLGRPYYVGILSAAALYGAAHHQPQEFQVVTDLSQRTMKAGRSRIRFLVRSNLKLTSVRELKTETGAMRVSSPEATALDLLRYVQAAGGLSNVATVLVDLADSIETKKLLEAAKADGELAHAQRLGYLLNLIGVGEKAKHLEKWIKQVNPGSVPLKPGVPMKGSTTDQRFRVAINSRLEVDL
jgi:predicted transcriptional regulator of viral defense system